MQNNPVVGMLLKQLGLTPEGVTESIEKFRLSMTDGIETIRRLEAKQDETLSLLKQILARNETNAE